MSAFEKTMYHIRVQLMDENDKVVDEFNTKEMEWLRLREHFDRIKRSTGVKRK